LLVSEDKICIKANFAPFVVQMAISILNVALSCSAAFVTPVSVAVGGCQTQTWLLNVRQNSFLQIL